MLLQHSNTRSHSQKIIIVTALMLIFFLLLRRREIYCVACLTINNLKLENLPHPLYSPDIAPFDYHLFVQYKIAKQRSNFRVKGPKKYSMNAERLKIKQFFATRIHQMPERWQWVFEVTGDYIGLVLYLILFVLIKKMRILIMRVLIKLLIKNCYALRERFCIPNVPT